MLSCCKLANSMCLARGGALESWMTTSRDESSGWAEPSVSSLLQLQLVLKDQKVGALCILVHEP